MPFMKSFGFFRRERWTNTEYKLNFYIVFTRINPKFAGKHKTNPTKNLIIFGKSKLNERTKGSNSHIPQIVSSPTCAHFPTPLESVCLAAHLSRAQENFTWKKARISSDLAITHLTHSPTVRFRWQKATPKNCQLLNFALQMKTYV